MLAVLDPVRDGIAKGADRSGDDHFETWQNVCLLILGEPVDPCSNLMPPIRAE